jgi:SAM-dependent methyltransferase
LSNEERLDATRALWDDAAATFDDEADHGLRDPLTHAAWRDLLTQWLPPSPKKILDAGCGTGSLSLLMAGLGHEVTGIDLSPAMVSRAKAKIAAAGLQATFHVMDAAYPRFAPQTYDIIVCRHLLWALPQPAQVLERWRSLLTASSRMILIEGFWNTGTGLHAEEIVDALPTPVSNVVVERLSDNARLWGGAVSDERYMIVADYASESPRARLGT